MNDLTRAEDLAYAFLDGTTRYFLTRAKLLSKWQKNSSLGDWLRSVQELDEKEFIQMKLSAFEIRYDGDLTQGITWLPCMTCC